MTANWANQTIWTADNLPVLRGMNDESVDLIYLDPPFNSKTNYAAPIGSQAAGAEFKDTWTLDDLDIAWLDLIEAKYPALNKVIHAAMTKSDKSYLIYMAVRLLEMKRILKDTGSIYLHCDPTMSHYLKLVMDAIFGKGKFRNEIVWRYKKYQKAKMRYFTRNSDRLLFYVASSVADGCFSPVFEKLKKPKRFLKRIWDKETKRIVNEKDNDGRVQYMTVHEEKVDEVWEIPYIMPASKERVGYPTQKPLKLLQRIIKASCPDDGIILDPFCGCATACIAAEIEQRQWAGIDISPKAAELVEIRMRKELDLFYQGLVRTDIPQRTDMETLKKYNHPDNKIKLYGEQGGHCNGCSEHFLPQNLTVDHIIPKSKGGTDHLTNLQLLCGYCNSVKGDRGQEYLIAKLAA